MEWVEVVIKIGALVGATIAIWQFGKKIISAVWRIVEEFRLIREAVTENLENVKRIPEIEKHCLENYLTGLRLTIMNDDMPIGERITAGATYLKLGGNGEIKKYLINELHINEVQNDLEE